MSLERLGTAEKDAFVPVWDRLMTERPITCSVTGESYPAASKPTVVIMSVSGCPAVHPGARLTLSQGMEFPLFPVIRASQPAPPIFVYQSSAAAGIAQFLLPPHLGGISEDLVTPFNDDERKNGRPFDISGKIIKTPGLPAMYDWELHPADTSYFGVKPGFLFWVANMNMQ